MSEQESNTELYAVIEKGNGKILNVDYKRQMSDAAADHHWHADVVKFVRADSSRERVVADNVRAVMDYMEEKGLLDDFQLWLNGTLDAAMDNHTGASNDRN